MEIQKKIIKIKKQKNDKDEDEKKLILIMRMKEAWRKITRKQLIAKTSVLYIQ